MRALVGWGALAMRVCVCRASATRPGDEQLPVLWCRRDTLERMTVVLGQAAAGQRWFSAKKKGGDVDLD